MAEETKTVEVPCARCAGYGVEYVERSAGLAVPCTVCGGTGKVTRTIPASEESVRW